MSQSVKEGVVLLREPFKLNKKLLRDSFARSDEDERREQMHKVRRMCDSICIAVDNGRVVEVTVTDLDVRPGVEAETLIELWSEDGRIAGEFLVRLDVAKRPKKARYRKPFNLVRKLEG